MEVVIRTYIVSYTDVNHRVGDANGVKDFGTSRHTHSTTSALASAGATFLIDILLSEKQEHKREYQIEKLKMRSIGSSNQR